MPSNVVVVITPYSVMVRKNELPTLTEIAMELAIYTSTKAISLIMLSILNWIDLVS